MFHNKEIEVRFLDINKQEIIKKLHFLGAIDKGESFARETIFYHKDDLQREHNKKGLVRIRSINNDIFMAFKERNIVKNKKQDTIEDVTEIEIKIDNKDKGEKILQELNIDQRIIFESNDKLREYVNIFLTDYKGWGIKDIKNMQISEQEREELLEYISKLYTTKDEK